MIHNVVAVAVLLLAWVAGPGTPDLSGSWVLNPVKSTANPIPKAKGPTRLIITQNGNNINFDSYDGNGLDHSSSFVVDDKERPRYKTRLERAYARARWDKGELVIVTRSFLDPEGTQSYTDVERWSLAKDGKTLVHKLSDGKVEVYEKKEPARATNPPFSPPAMPHFSRSPAPKTATLPCLTGVASCRPAAVALLTWCSLQQRSGIAREL